MDSSFREWSLTEPYGVRLCLVKGCDLDLPLVTAGSTSIQDRGVIKVDTHDLSLFIAVDCYEQFALQDPATV